MSNPIEHRRGMFNRPEFDELVDGYNQSIPPLTKDVTYHVSPTGNDSNDGLSAATPLKTINAALRKLPETISANATIQLAPGTYIEYLSDNRNFVSNPLTRKSSIQFEGSFKTYTPTVGFASGTFDASFGSPATPNIALDTGAGWVVNELAGKFIEILSGARIGMFLPIAENTADTITISHPAASGTFDLRNIQYRIVEQAVVLQHPGDTLPFLVAITGNSDVDANTTYTTARPATNGYLFYGIKFISLTSKNMINARVTCRIDSCVIEQQGAGVAGSTYNLLLEEGIFASCVNSYLKSRTTSPPNTVLVQAQRGAGLVITGVLEGGIICLLASSASSIIATNTVCQNAGLTGWNPSGGSITCSFFAVIKNCPRGIRSLNNPSTVGFSSSSPGLFILNSATMGIEVAAPLFAQAVSDNGFVTIDGCATGIIFRTEGSNLNLRGTLTIKNSTTYGVRIGDDRIINYSGLGYASAKMTMTGNVSGDFTFDGTTPISLADVEAAPNKIVLDSTGRGNYVRGGA